MKITERAGSFLRGVVDNPLVESRLHELHQDNEIIFHACHILAVHDIHRRELVAAMNLADLQELAQWVGEMQRPQE